MYVQYLFLSFVLADRSLVITSLEIFAMNEREAFHEIEDGIIETTVVPLTYSITKTDGKIYSLSKYEIGLGLRTHI